MDFSASNTRFRFLSGIVRVVLNAINHLLLELAYPPRNLHRAVRAGTSFTFSAELVSRGEWAWCLCARRAVWTEQHKQMTSSYVFVCTECCQNIFRV